MGYVTQKATCGQPNYPLLLYHTHSFISLLLIHKIKLYKCFSPCCSFIYQAKGKFRGGGKSVWSTRPQGEGILTFFSMSFERGQPCPIRIALKKENTLRSSKNPKHQPSGKGGTRSQPVTPHCLQNLKWPPWGPKMADGVWKGGLPLLFGRFHQLL